MLHKVFSKKQAKKDKKEENPFHIEYGILGNCFYILKMIRKYCPRALVFMGVGMVTGSLIQYIWSFAGKFVIDIVQAQAQNPDQDIMPLVKLLIIVTLIELVSMTCNTVVNNRQWYSFIYVRMKLISERVSKALTMNYQMLEQPKILDMNQKALRATNSNDNGVEGLMHSIYKFGIQFMLMLVTVSAVAILDWRMLLVLAMIGILQYLFFRHTVKKDRREVWDKLAPTWRKVAYMNRVTQDFDYAKDIRLFDMKNWLSAKHHEALKEKQSKMLYSRNLWIRYSAFANAMSMISAAFVYGILIYNVLGRDMSIGNFTLYLGLSTTFSTALTDFLNSIGAFKDQSMEVDDFRSFVNLEPEARIESQPVKSQPVKNQPASVQPEEFLPIPQAGPYTITFKDVSYRYEGADGYALKHLNLTLESGKRLAIVGLNGAGKTTFIKLLLRLYDASEGEILLNGTDIRKFRREEYYKLFAPVFQNVEVFAFPIAENVSMKRPEDTDKERSRSCLIKAGLQEKIESLAHGADTQLLKVIEEDGVDFSGGERQKLALARALYKDAPIIVLDEPTAALDALAEYNLYRSFDDIIGDKSAVYISHRLSSTRFCDNIAMFQAGKLIEYGSHEELLLQGGAYADMFEIQAQYYKDKEAAVNV